MKKYLVAMVLSVAFVSVNAQTDKGSFLVGGSLDLSRNQRTYGTPQNPANLANSPYVSFSVNPTAGFFVANNLMVGVQGSYRYSWQLNASSVNVSAISGGPILRRYFLIGRFAVFPEVAALLGSTSTIYNEDHGNGVVTTETSKSKSTTYRAGLGTTWFVTKTIGIEGIIAYEDHEYKKRDINNQTYLYLNFGIQFYLHKK